MEGKLICISINPLKICNDMYNHFNISYTTMTSLQSFNNLHNVAEIFVEWYE